MKTLEEHNAERYKVFGRLHNEMEPHPNGIACPKCSNELWDSNPTLTLTSLPPQKNVHCPSCRYSGYRIA